MLSSKRDPGCHDVWDDDNRQNDTKHYEIYVLTAHDILPLSIMKLGITALSITTLSMKKLSIMTLTITTLSMNDTYHNGT